LSGIEIPIDIQDFFN